MLKGIDPAYGDRRRDFGRGFYTTTYEAQAREWAIKATLRLRNRLRRKDLNAAVLRLQVPLAALAPLHSLAFVRPDSDNALYWGLIHHCRNFPPGDGPDPEAYTHQYAHAEGGSMYDLVSGPVAATWGTNRHVYPGYDQFSFHTARAAAILNAALTAPHGRGQTFGIEIFSV